MLLILPFFIAQPAAAENTPAPAVDIVKGDFGTGLKHTSSGRVDAVIDAQTILLKDGKIVRLLGIDYPFMAGDMNGGPMIAAKSRLEKLLPDGTEVMLYQTRDQKIARANRMGHILAHLVNKKDERWINGTLVREGLAWTMTDLSNPQMAAELYALENLARADAKGLWSKNSPFGVLTPETAGTGSGTFRVVEGVVNRAAVSKNNLYLNFGTDWKKDFTVMISPAIRKALAKQGLDPMSLAKQPVRVRGWIREWNGPFIELETAERLQVLVPANMLPTHNTGLSPSPSTPLSTEPPTTGQ